MTSPFKFTSSQKIEISLYGTLFNFKGHPTLEDHIISIGNDHDLSIWNLNNAQLIKKIKGSKTALADGCVSKDGKVYTLLSNDGILTVYSDELIMVRNVKQDFLENVVPIQIEICEFEEKKIFVIGTSSPTVYIYKIFDNSIVLNKQFNINQDAWVTQIKYLHNYNTLLLFQDSKIDIFKIDNTQDNFTLEQTNQFSIEGAKGQILAHDILIENDNEIYISIGDSNGTASLIFINRNFDNYKLIFQHKLISAVLQVQLIRFSGQNYMICGCLDNGIEFLNFNGVIKHLIKNRAAPFYFSEKLNKLICRSDTVTRIAYLEY